jgi:hypothetical protein
VPTVNPSASVGAGDIRIVDAGQNFESDDIEGALAELAEGGGAVTPAEYIVPETATPEAIVDALIAAGLMEGPP